MDKAIWGLILSALLLAGGVLFTKVNDESEYVEWKEKYGHTFSESEDAYRRFVFDLNMGKIKEHNADASQTYQMGVNQFTAYTEKEFVSLFLNPRPYNPDWQHEDLEPVPINSDIDWTTKGAVSPVKNQGNCGSCWAFSAIATLESKSLMNGGSGIFSEQQLVDCSKKYGNEGCNGGFNYRGLAYVKDHGITTSSSYPYTAKTGSCRMDGGSYKISNVDTTKGCSGIASAVQSRPIGVSVDATKWSNYKSGIFNNCSTNLNHDVLLVGETSSYHKIKNSWSTSWGENGFIRLAPGNTCGICQDKSPWPV